MARLIASTELRERISRQDVLLLDVSEVESFSSGHIPNALNIPLESLRDTANEQRGEFAKKDYIIVYGDGHHAELSDQASRILEELGFDRVGNFDGGRTAWHNAGYALVSSDDEVEGVEVLFPYEEEFGPGDNS